MFTLKRICELNKTFFSPQVEYDHGKMQNMAEAVTTVLLEMKKINLL